MPEIPLTGCTPEPLMNYLKALGVFRLVAEQPDPEARLSWSGGVARLASSLNRETLTSFFVSDYRPTPITSPWNGGSGFYRTWDDRRSRFRSRQAVDRVTFILNSEGDRFAPYRTVLEQVLNTLRRYAKAIDIRAMSKKERNATLLLDETRGILDADQPRLLPYLRATLPDEALKWLDTVLLLQLEETRAAPLFISGGNDGNFDFSVTFIGYLQALFTDSERAKGWFNSSIFAEGVAAQDKGTSGHLHPGGLGGPNAAQGFSGSGGVNPWDFVLMVEGAVLLAGAVSRRLGVQAGERVAFPFCVLPIAAGVGSGAPIDETSEGCRTEMWLPLWSGKTTIGELQYLFSEGRAQFGRRQARNAVEFALATCLLGVSRGIESFVRFAFLRRFGKMFLAAPVGRVDVTPRPKARLLDDPPLTEWIDRLRSACRDKERTPARYQAVLRQIDRSMYEFAVRSEKGNDAKYLLELLRALGRAERTLSNGLAFCKDKHIRPLAGLNPQWLIDVAPSGDAGREFRLAAALASIMGEPKKELGGLRTHLEPVEQIGEWVNWSPGSTSAVWSRHPLSENLSAVLLRRLMESERAGVAGCALRARVFAPLNDVIAFISRQTNDEALAELLWGLAGLNWTSNEFRRRSFRRQQAERFRSPGVIPAPAAFGLIRLTLTQLRLATEAARNRRAREGRWRVVTKGELPSITTTASAAPFHALARGDVSHAEQIAARRLWSDRIIPFGWANRQQRGQHQSEFDADPARLLAACLFPLSSHSLSRLARQSLSPPVPVG